MRIGILEAGRTMPEVKSKHGTFPDMFAHLLAGHDFQLTPYHVEDMHFPDSITEQDGWLITGSRHGAYEDHAFIPPLEDFIRDAYSRSVPMVGICFGHQIIAQALGGHVEKFTGGWALGHTTYELEGDKVHLNAWHQDQVTRLPDGARVVGSNAFCEYAALVYDKPIYSIQPHPEFSGEVIADYAQIRRGMADYPDALMDRAGKLSSEPNDNAKIGKRIAQFFLHAREVADA